MAEVTGLRNNALPYPCFGLPYGIVAPLLDADGDPVSPSSPDSEVSKNGDTFADCTNEATEIATSSGVCYLLLTGTEMTADVVAVRIQSTGAKTTVLTLYPRKLVTIRTGTSASAGSSTSTIVLDASASAVDDFYNGMVVAAVIDSVTEVRMITDYTGSTQTATVTPDWNTAPDNNDTFTIYLPEGVQLNQSNLTHVSGVAVSASAGLLNANVTQVSGDSTAADNAEAFFDGTGYAGTNNVIPTVTAVTTVNALAANSVTASALASDAVTEIQSGLSTLDAAGVRSAVGLASANLDTQLTAIDDYLDTEVAAIKAKTDNLPSDPADASDIASSFSTVNSTLSTIAGYIDTEVSTILSRLGTPSDLGSGASVAANLADIEAQTDEIGAAGVGLTAITSLLPAALVGGRIDANVGAISADSTAADNLESAYDGTGFGEVLVRTTIATLSSQTSFTLTAGSADDGAYVGCVIVIEDASTAAQKAVGVISAYTGSTKTVTLLADPAVFTMATTDVVTVLADRSVKATVPTRTLDVTATGAAGIDWANVENPTTTVGLSGTTVKTATDVETDTADIQTRLPAALVSGRIDASVGAMAADTLTSSALAASAVTEIQSGLATASALSTVEGKIDTIDGIVDDILVDTGTTLQAELDGIQADTEDIQTRLPAALVGGRIDASVGAMAANTLTASALATDAVSEIQSGLATASALSTVATYIDTEVATILARLPVVTGTVSASPTPTTTVFAVGLGAYQDEQFTGALIYFLDGNAASEGAKPIQSVTFSGLIGTVTVRVPFVVAPSAGSTAYVVLNSHVPAGVNVTQWRSETPDTLTAGRLNADIGGVNGGDDDIEKLEAFVGAINLSTGGVLVNALTTAGKAEVQTEAEDALVAKGLDHLLSASVTGTDVTDNSIVARLVSKSTTADWDSYSNQTDSLEAIRDRGDAAWVTATGFSTLDAAGVRTAVGLASANLDTQLSTIDDFLDTEIAAIKAKTDNLPSDPADASDIASAFSTVNSTLSTIAGYLDTEVSTILSRLGTPSDLGSGASVAANLVDIEAQTDDIGAAGAGLTALASAANLATLTGYVDTEVAAIKTKTDQLTFSSAGKVDASLQAAGDLAAAVCNKVADHVRRRSQASVEASSHGDSLSLASLYGFIQQAQESNTTTTPGTLTVYQTDGTTVLGTRALSTSASAEAVTGVS